MDYQVYSPCLPLGKYIKCYWSLEVSKTEEPPARQRVFADGCIELLFHFGDLFQKYHRNDEIIIQPRSFVHGQVKRFIEIEPTGSAGIFSVRFMPNGLRPFLPYRIDELTDQTPTVSELWGKEGDVLEDRILNARTNALRIELIESFLLKKLRNFKARHLFTDHCVDSIFKSNGMISIDDLANDLSIGRRQLERKFIEAVGLSPKHLSRIIRFQNVLNLLEKRQFNSLTALAYEGGFYDQAHFIKDFREFTGFNPKQYFAEDMEMAKYFNS